VFRKNTHPTVLPKWKRTRLWLAEGKSIGSTAQIVMVSKAMEKEKWPKT
jgi:hypothetical protein